MLEVTTDSLTDLLSDDSSVISVIAAHACMVSKLLAVSILDHPQVLDVPELLLRVHLQETKEAGSVDVDNTVGQKY